jgi:hypothetical protein
LTNSLQNRLSPQSSAGEKNSIAFHRSSSASKIFPHRKAGSWPDTETIDNHDQINEDYCGGEGEQAEGPCSWSVDVGITGKMSYNQKHLIEMVSNLQVVVFNIKYKKQLNSV